MEKHVIYIRFMYCPCCIMILKFLVKSFIEYIQGVVTNLRAAATGFVIRICHCRQLSQSIKARAWKNVAHVTKPVAQATKIVARATEAEARVTEIKARASEIEAQATRIRHEL